MINSTLESRNPDYSCHIPVRWGDMDAYGHVNNTVYFRYFEEARVKLLADIGVAIVADQKIGPVLITANCTFLRPVVYPDTVVVNCYLSDPGRSSFLVSYQVFTESMPDQIACTGDSKIVWIDHQSGKSVAFPDSIRDKIIND